MLHIETPRMTVGELAEHIESKKEPVRRSSHLGNQAAKELVLMAGFPAGVDIILVDTIPGNDQHSLPYTAQMGDRVVSLRSRSSSEKRVVGSLTAIDPIDGVERTLQEIHDHPYDHLNLNNRPVPMLEFFSKYPLAFRVLMGVAANLGEVHRQVTEGGRIEPVTGTITDVYGLDGPQGALVPLNAMMSMDLLVSTIEGSDRTTHLGGRDMTVYTQDQRRMARVGAIYSRACAVLGLGNRDHLYRIVDGRGLGAITPHVSQHHLLNTGAEIDISPHIDLPAGLIEKDKL